MQARRLFLIGLLVVVFGCASVEAPSPKMASTYAPVESSLTLIDQKVANHLIRGIPDTFDKDHYMQTIDEVCRSNPECLSKARMIFASYGVKVRKIDDMFSVMLCDKEMKWKIMEDLSCNNLIVEIKTWKTGINEQCAFEEDWQRVKQEFCRE